ncbi:MAG TPA: NTP transferase domain-containing protein [Polyangiaceae bacterium]|jgi:molybdenum cofactor cytidylyltransferase
MSIATLVLAACSPGFVGAPRQLALEEGQPLVRLVSTAAIASACDAVVVVTGGPRTDRVDAALAGLDVVTLPNTRWIEGVASSVRAGVAWADAQGFDAVVIVAADRNRASAEHLDALVRLHRRVHATVATRHEGVLGLPAVFGRPSFRALMGLLGDRGPCELVAASDAAVDWPRDVDAEQAPTRSGFRMAAAVRTTRGRTARR